MYSMNGGNATYPHPGLMKQYTSETVSVSSDDEEQRLAATTPGKRRSFLLRKPPSKRPLSLDDGLLKNTSFRKTDNDSNAAVACSTSTHRKPDTREEDEIEVTYRQWTTAISSVEKRDKKKKKPWSKLFGKIKEKATISECKETGGGSPLRRHVPLADNAYENMHSDLDATSTDWHPSAKKSQSFRTCHSMETQKKSNVTSLIHNDAGISPISEGIESSLDVTYPIDRSSTGAIQACSPCQPFLDLFAKDTNVQRAEAAAEEHPTNKATRSLGPVDVDNAQFVESDHLSLKHMHALAADEIKAGDFDEALFIFHEIIRLLIERHGEENNIHVGAIWHNIGIVNSKAKRCKDAVTACQKAIQIRENLLGENHQEVAVSLSQLGIAYMDLRQYEQSLEAFRRALKIREDHFGCHHVKVAKILNNMGCVLFEMGELSDSESAFKEALEIHRVLLTSAENSTNADSTLLSIASTQCSIGSIQLTRKEFNDAISAFDEALVLQQSVLGGHHNTVITTMQSIDHAHRLQAEEECCFKISNDYCSIGEYLSKNSMGNKKGDASVTYDREDNLCEF